MSTTFCTGVMRVQGRGVPGEAASDDEDVGLPSHVTESAYASDAHAVMLAEPTMPAPRRALPLRKLLRDKLFDPDIDLPLSPFVQLV